MSAPNPELGKEPEEIGVLGPRPARRQAFAVAPQVVADHAMGSREGRPLGIPHPPIRDAGVDEDERLA
jgi:hypothetical protein